MRPFLFRICGLSGVLVRLRADVDCGRFPGAVVVEWAVLLNALLKWRLSFDCSCDAAFVLESISSVALCAMLESRGWFAAISNPLSSVSPGMLAGVSR